MVKICDKTIEEEFSKSIRSVFRGKQRELVERLMPIEAKRDFLIVNKFDEYVAANKGKITHAMVDLEDRFAISDRQLRNVLKRSRNLLIIKTTKVWK